MGKIVVRCVEQADPIGRIRVRFVADRPLYTVNRIAHRVSQIDAGGVVKRHRKVGGEYVVAVLVANRHWEGLHDVLLVGIAKQRARAKEKSDGCVDRWLVAAVPKDAESRGGKGIGGIIWDA